MNYKRRHYDYNSRHIRPCRTQRQTTMYKQCSITNRLQLFKHNSIDGTTHSVIWDNYQSFKLQGFLGFQLLGIVPKLVSVNRLKQLNLLLWRQFCSAQIIVNAAKYYTTLYSRHWLTRMNDQANYSNSQEGSLQTCCLFMNEKLHAKDSFKAI